MSATGVFITIEGGEGVGKSTNIRHLQNWLQTHDIAYTLTREPGGTPLAESIRELLLQKRDEKVAVSAELLLIFAARAQHIEQVIRPALERGEWVLCDRFTDATYAYQGGGRDMPLDQISTLETLVQNDLRPDITLLLDAPVEVGMSRAGERGELDRFELEELDFFRRVRSAYLQRAQDEPTRFRVVDTDRDLAAIQEELSSIMNTLEDSYRG